MSYSKFSRRNDGVGFVNLSRRLVADYGELSRPLDFAFNCVMSRIFRQLDRSVVRVAGEGGVHFLNGLCSQDLTKFANSAFTCFLNAQGRVLFDAIVHKAPNELLLDVHASLADKVVLLLQRHRLRLPIVIEQAKDLQVSTAEGSSFFDDPRFPGLPRRAIEMVNNHPDGTAWFRAKRIAAGVPEGPEEFPADSALPLNMNLDLLNGVSFSKGCYVGQEMTTRTFRRGVIRRRVFILKSDEALGLDEVQCQGEPVGKVIAVEGGVSLAQLHTRQGDALNEAKKAAELISAMGPVTVAGKVASIIIPDYFR